MAFARTSVVNNTDVAQAITCALGSNAGNATDGAHIQDLPVGAEQTITVLGPIDFSTTGAAVVFLECTLSGAVGTTGTVSYTDNQVSAIQVGSLSNSGPSPVCTDQDGDGDEQNGGIDDGDGCL